MTESTPHGLDGPLHDGPLHVAIVAWQALPAAAPDTGRHIGGLETAAWLLARGLSRRDSVNCIFVVRGKNPLPTRQVEGVQIVVDVDPREYVRRDVSEVFQDGFAGAFRRLRPKLLWQLPYLALTWPRRRPDPKPQAPDPRLQDLRPDIWIGMGVSRESAGVVATARDQKRPSVLMIQSNADLDARYASDATFQNRYGERAGDCLFAIRHADLIVCQTSHQLDLLRDSFSREGVLLRNAIDIDRWAVGSANEGEHVLWIGRYDQFHKRPHLAMHLAERCGDIPFRMIINRSDSVVENEIRAMRPENVRIEEYVPADRMPAEMAACRLFLSTGAAAYEGFPNVLLQAAAAGKPIVSLEDFDGFLVDSGAGFDCDSDLDVAASRIRELWDRTRVFDSGSARRYLRENHSVDAIVARLLELLRELNTDVKIN